MFEAIKLNYLTFFKFLKEKKLGETIIAIIIFLYPIFIAVGPALMECAIFICIIFFLKNKNYLQINYKNFFIIFFVLFYFSLILSSIFSDDEYKIYSLKHSVFLIRFFIFSCVVFFFLKQNKSLLKPLAIFYTLIVFFFIFDQFVQVIFGKDIFFIKPISITIYSGVFAEQKILGSYITKILPIAVYLMMCNFNIKFEKYTFFIIVIIFLSLLFSSERMALIYYFFAVMAFIYFFKKKFKKILFIFFILFSILSSGLYFLGINKFDQTVKDTMNQIYSDKLFFFSSQHETFAKTSVELFKKNPIFGIGPSNYRNYSNQIDLKDNWSTHPHNIFFQLLCETGIMGIFFYFTILIFVIRSLCKILTSNKNYPNILLLLSFLFYFNPFFPSGNLFNNWYMSIGTFALPFYFLATYDENKKFNFK